MFKLYKEIVLTVSIFSMANMSVAKSVVLDAGHSPKQAGTTAANGYPEYIYNLSMTNSIEYFLKRNKIEMHRTFTKEQKISLVDRATRHGNANLLISIHHDSNPKELDHLKNSLHGFSIFVSKKNPHFSKSLKCADHIGKNLIASGETPSTFHGLKIPGENKELLTRNGVYKYNDLVVLKRSNKPAILIEIGVISNPNEAQRLSNQQVIWRISENIANSITNCLSFI